MADVILDALPTRQVVRLESLPTRQEIRLDALPTRQVVRLESLPTPRYHTFFTGVGSLTARAAILAKAALSAAGTLTLRSGVSGGAVATSGSGTLAASTRASVKAAGSGSGSLSTVVRLGAGSVSLSGEGSWVNVVRSMAAAALSAVGAASAATRVAPSAVQPSGSGSAAAATRVNLPMALSGAGTLGQTTLGRGVVGAGFTAEGQARDETSAWASAFFQAEGMPSTVLSGRFYVNADLTGAGTAAVVSRVSLAAQATGAGSLAAAAFPGARLTAAFTGAATLTVPTAAGVTAGLTGAGTTTALGYEVEMAVAVGSASGALVSVIRNPATAADSGEGTVTAVTRVQTPAVATGVGALQAVTVIPAPVMFSGSGSFSAPSVQAAFTPMKATKTGTQAVATNTWTKVTGWTADTSQRLGSTVTDDGLTPGGVGQNVQVTAAVAFANGTGTHSVRLKAGDTVLATADAPSAGRTAVVTFVGALPYGNLTVEVSVTSASSSANVVAEAGTSVTVDYPMAVDGTSSDQGNGNRAWTHQVTRDGLLFVSLTHLNPNAGTPTPTMDGVAMTLVGRSVVTSGQGFITTHVAYARAGSRSLAISTSENYSVGMAIGYAGCGAWTLAETRTGLTNAPTTSSFSTLVHETLASMFFTKLNSSVTTGTVRLAVDHSSGFNFARAMENSASPAVNRLSMPSSDRWCSVSATISP